MTITLYLLRQTTSTTIITPTSQMKTLTDNPISRFVQFGEGNTVTCLASHQVPASLHEKFTLLRYFAQVKTKT